MRLRIAGPLAAAAMLAAAGAGAQEAGRMARVEAAFESADRNDDMRVDVDEYVGHYVMMFASVDPDDDGMLSLSDVPQVDPEDFAEADRDGDGRVSLGEAIAERMILFFEIDTARDGVLSMDEIMAHERAAAN